MGLVSRSVKGSGWYGSFPVTTYLGKIDGTRPLLICLRTNPEKRACIWRLIVFQCDVCQGYRVQQPGILNASPVHSRCQTREPS